MVIGVPDTTATTRRIIRPMPWTLAATGIAALCRAALPPRKSAAPKPTAAAVAAATPKVQSFMRSPCPALGGDRSDRHGAR